MSRPSWTQAVPTRRVDEARRATSKQRNGPLGAAAIAATAQPAPAVRPLVPAARDDPSSMPKTGALMAAAEAARRRSRAGDLGIDRVDDLDRPGDRRQCVGGAARRFDAAVVACARAARGDDAVLCPEPAV
ncbi:MAG: hypothetical protein QNJ91_17200 [Gammaproteobacteria bacterium]|nr:hypothetical protein [Gammaproteobacteria bacterium]